MSARPLQTDIRRARAPAQGPHAGRVLLITPPLVQPNTPYPATACLAGFLKARRFAVAQADLSLELLLRLFSVDGLRRVEQGMRRSRRASTPATRHFLQNAARCKESVEPVVRFLQGRDETLAWRIAGRGWLPEGRRFHSGGAEAGDADNIQDRARHLASLFLDDVADAIRDGIDADFGFARYAEHLATDVPGFAALRRHLEAGPTLIGRMLDEAVDCALATHRPALVGLTVPFPGMLQGALRIARRIRQCRPGCRIVMGGGYVNTELRELDDPAFFDYVDYLCYDDGEEPLLRIAEQGGRADDTRLVRTLVRRRGRVVRCGMPGNDELPLNAERRTPNVTPDYSGLPLNRYFSLVESLNPLRRLWSDGRWLKLPLAHGCYWHRCRFCDTGLDYIGRYVPPRAENVVATLREVRRQTGLSGFHFTDEALAPALVRRVSERLVEADEPFTWWGNIRFEAAFDRRLSRLMARAGCVAVAGGLECANDRLLALMRKGVTLHQAARACKAFAAAGIHVHTYLMYGFPTQTLQEAVDGLEFVRQLFEAGAAQSAYWHRFALTVHSPLACAAKKMGLRIHTPRRVPGRTFGINEIPYFEPGAPDWRRIGQGLQRAIFNYMQGRGIDESPVVWFDLKAPAPTLPPDFVHRA